MNRKTTLALATFAVAIGSAFAADLSAAAPLTREQVRDTVLAARAAGDLKPAGPEYDGPAPRGRVDFDVTRAEVRHEVAVARAEGQLEPAGEAGDSALPLPPPSTSTLSRATVKAETLLARDDGELIPAGEDIDGGASRSMPHATAQAGFGARVASLFHAK